MRNSLVVGAFLRCYGHHSLATLDICLVILVDVGFPLDPAQRHTILALLNRNALILGLLKGCVLTGLEIMEF